MAQLPQGWYELVTDRAGRGTRYRFELEDGLRIPDPASRFQPEDVQGASEVIDAAEYQWRDSDWRGRPWHEAVIYELHVGTFTPGGTFLAAIEKLDHLAHLGVTAIEIMPVAEFPGRRDWGYDGVLPFAPDSSYGRPNDRRDFVDAAHSRGLIGTVPRLDARELREVYTLRVNRQVQAGHQHEASHEHEPVAHGRHEVADIHAIAPVGRTDDLLHHRATGS